MPSLLHEALIELFRAQPALAAQLYCASQGLPPPGAVQVQLAEAELGQLAPPQYRADAVLSCSDALCMDLILEVQLGIDPDKAGVWAVYVAVQYDRGPAHAWSRPVWRSSSAGVTLCSQPTAWSCCSAEGVSSADTRVSRSGSPAELLQGSLGLDPDRRSSFPQLYAQKLGKRRRGAGPARSRTYRLGSKIHTPA